MLSNKQRRNPLLIVFGLLSAVILTVSAVVGYVNWASLSKAIPEKEIKKEVARPAPEVVNDQSAAVVAESVTSSDLMQESRPARIDKKAPAREEKVNDTLYASIPAHSERGNASSRPERVVKHLKNPMSWPSRDVLPPDLPKVRSGGSGASGVSTSPYDQAYSDSPYRDIIPDNSSDVVDEVKKEKIEPVDPGEQSNNYSVSVSRSINAGKVMLTVAVKDNPPNGLIINEKIPAGWQITSASPAPLNCRSYPCTGSMKWLFITRNVGNDITYTLKKIGDSAGSSISGNYLFKDSAAGDMTVTTKGTNGV